MATAPMKSQPLHNFSLSFLKWGASTSSANHRSRLNSLTDTSEPENDSDHDSTRPNRVGSRSSRQQRQSFPSSEKLHNKAEKGEDDEAGGGGEEETVAKPWNLRPRKTAAVESSNGGAVECSGNNEKQKPKSMRLREMVESKGNNHVEKKEKTKFWLSLSRDEIEEDVFVMTGSRPARRPRKRPRNVQKQLDVLFTHLL